MTQLKDQVTYRTYTTRKMPVDLYRRLRILMVHLPPRAPGAGWTLEETLNDVVLEGLKVMEKKVGLDVLSDVMEGR